ncbi:MAG: 1-acyl-sn-glycerol-3-phosphate acyltransferase, partial [Pseudomonadota bacterium]
MTQTWFSNDPPPPPLGFTRADYARIARRGVPLALNTFGCLLLLLLLRVIEWPLFRHRRPITPFITRYVCRSAFWIWGMGYQVSGQPMTGPGALADNHVSWLDIFALNA